MAGEAPYITLNDGNKIPVVALGTGRGTSGSAPIDEVRDAVLWAIEAGYRHIDTAVLYQDETQVGQGIADAINKGLVTREQVFVTTKLPNDRHARGQVVPTLRESLARLGVAYVDLFLIHFPIATKSDGSPDDIDYLETWKGMEDAKELGLAKSIGVSNFNAEQIDRLIAESKVKPAVNQIEVHPAHTNEELVDYCQKKGIAVMAYSPFGFLVSRRRTVATPPAIDDPTLVKMADKYDKTTGQIVLRYLIDRGLIPVPKSANKERIAQNINLFDFKLTPEEVSTINKFNKNSSCTNAEEAPRARLNDGNMIPILALGTFGSDEDRVKLRQAVNDAVEVGYRHIDTAAFYKNEEQIGQGISDVIEKGLVKREDLFITTKLWNDRHACEQVVPALNESLSRLGLDYVDLYLIHSPGSQREDGTYDYIDYLETWIGMQEAKNLGLAKSIGVSNFNSVQIKRIIDNCEIVPAVNQIEVHPALTQEKLIPFCHNWGINVMAYSPFGFLVSRDTTDAPPPRLDDPILENIAKKYGKSTSQVVLRYLIDRGAIPVPKSTNKKRLTQNIDVFDFQLTADEISTINKFNKNRRVFDTSYWKDHPHYPFNID
ncbi:prostaglandin F synthase 1 [Aphomia sociella]